ncbi:hypothetical protein HZS_6203 [Henneguya salminicola]|nr:hypothetical protein HZS_6203 [Henneguya salminicola]
MFAAVAFIKEDNFIQAELLKYYEDTFIGRHPRINRSQPLFPIRFWNKSKRTEKGISRTNNKVENWHNALARLVGGNYPDILKFLASLQRELRLVDVKIDTTHYAYSPKKY